MGDADPKPRSFARTFNEKGRADVRTIGRLTAAHRSVYNSLLATTWPRFLMALVLVYSSINAVFATIYIVAGPCIEGAREGHFGDHFFFSVHTMSTIGYGTMHPSTMFANLLVTIQALVGMIGIAVTTGLCFAKFARPIARITFAEKMVTRPFQGKPHLMVRMANGRNSNIIEAHVRLTLLIDEIVDDDERMRRFYDLQLVRERSAFFAIGWTIMHPIDAASPLFEMGPEELARKNVEFLVSFMGTDEISSDTVHSRYAYHHTDIAWNHRFADMLSVDEDGERVVNYTKLHDVVPVGRQD